MKARPSLATDTMQVVAAERIARLVVAGFALCEGCDVPLAERQKAAVLTAVLLEFDGVREEVEGLRRVEELLSGLGGSNGGPPTLRRTA